MKLWRVVSLTRLINRNFKLFAGPKERYMLFSDKNLAARAGIAACPGLAAARGKGSKAAQFNTRALF